MVQFNGQVVKKNVGYYCRQPQAPSTERPRWQRCLADGMTSVNVSIAARNHSRPLPGPVLLGIIHYQDLEDALNRTYHMPDNR